MENKILELATYMKSNGIDEKVSATISLYAENSFHKNEHWINNHESYIYGYEIAMETTLTALIGRGIEIEK